MNSRYCLLAVFLDFGFWIFLDKMDFKEEIINEVICDPTLWDKRSEHYTNQAKTDRGWQAIADKLNKPSWHRGGFGVSSPLFSMHHKNSMNQDMTDSEGSITEDDGTSPPENTLRNRRVERSTGSSPKGKTTSPDDNVEPQYAIATVSMYSESSSGQPFLYEGDVIVSIRQTDNPNLWVGKNTRTGDRCNFYETWVKFCQGPLPTGTNIGGRGTPTNQQTRPKSTSEAKSNLVTYVILVVIVPLLVYCFCSNVSSFRSRSPVNITELKSAFKAQDPNMWDTLQAGLLPSKVEATKTFLFVHAKDGATVECLIKKLSDNYCNVYRASEMNLDETFVSTVNESLEKQKCMVIYDLENLQEDGITLLKGFCDAYTPIVPNAEFYFGLDTEDPPVDAEVAKVARQKLETMWSKKYSHDEFGGTVTRLIQNVLRVTGEEKLPC